MKKSLFLFLCLFSTHFLFAQTESKPAVQSEWGFDGQCMLSTDGKYGFVNFGGPNIQLTIKKVKISVGMYPSLRYFDANGKPDLTPSLGFGLMLNYKKLVIGLPCYYVGEENRTVATFGIGIRLASKK